jgi:hypothetical protein
MLSLTIEQLDAIIEYVASQLATIERIQSVCIVPKGVDKKQFKVKGTY